MSEERLEHSIALVLARWMGGENLREATEEVARMARLYYETGSSTTRSEYYTDEIGLPEDGKTISNSFYDKPWYFGSSREINFFIRIDYK